MQRQQIRMNPMQHERAYTYTYPIYAMQRACASVCSSVDVSSHTRTWQPSAGGALEQTSPRNYAECLRLRPHRHVASFERCDACRVLIERCDAGTLRCLLYSVTTHHRVAATCHDERLVGRGAQRPHLPQ
jgi:hypothetical protein